MEDSIDPVMAKLPDALGQSASTHFGDPVVEEITPAR
jgi:hypothetical protein